MLILIGYDIRDNKRRSKIFRIMKNYGLRVQYSVFEGDLESHHLKEMIREASDVVDHSVDSLRIYPVCASCVKCIKIIGIGELTDFPPAICI
jgi:CRISPR-associated protein Cas2